MDELTVTAGGPGDDRELLRLFDDAVAWLAARGQDGQWGTLPFSADPRKVARVKAWAAGGGLAFGRTRDGVGVGAIVLGEHPPYVPPPDRAELYIQVLLTASAWRGRGVGRRLVQHVEATARAEQVDQLRVDCWDGAPELPRHYERLGFTRTGSFDVDGWPGAILVRSMEHG